MFLLTQEDQNYLIDAVDRASDQIRSIYKSFRGEITFKSDSSPVTQADLLANAILVSSLGQRWPRIPILSEESQVQLGSDPELYWAVDPLDGTKEFINGNGQFTVNVALIEKGVPIFGVVAAPAMDILYSGGSAVGSARKRVQGIWMLMPQSPLEPQWDDYQHALRVVASRSHPSPDLSAWLKQYPNHQLIEVGSSLKLCFVAEGLADCYPRLGRTCIWDIAAGHAILKSLGGELWLWPRTPAPAALRYEHPSDPYNRHFIALGRAVSV
jgi:3'(2'), 5'-bisphosphate nucleotidase